MDFDPPKVFISLITKSCLIRNFSLTQSQRNKKTPNIFCRFYDFRRVRFAKNGQVCVAGFCDPKKDVSKEDLDLWVNVDDSVFENLNDQQVSDKFFKSQLWSED